ncbi:MAG: spermidine synthase [Actinomycetota bacterium]
MPGATDRSADRNALIGASFLMLFVELALIRWSSANVVYLAYFTNFVLLASFLGIGVGFLRAREDRDGFRAAPVALAVLVSFLLLLPAQVGRDESGERVFEGLFGMFALPIWITLPLIFIGVTVVLACVAEGVARLFARFEPLEAYRFDILGSLCGIAGFSVLSFLHAPPLVWGVLIAALFAWLLRGRLGRAQWISLAVVVVVFGIGSLPAFGTWSPYYRVTTSSRAADGGVGIEVNGLPHQSSLSLERIERDQPFYFHAYEHLEGNPLEDVLVIGAGNGNDVAVALEQGAGHVDAVEIDPVLQDIGREHHPNHPYQDPRVTPHVNDGRAFLERTDSRYDLIVLALPDSLTLVSGQGSLRLESYLFTEEAIATAREHLEPSGAFTMYNYYRPFVFERFAGTMAKVFGHEPCFDAGEDSLGVRRQAVLTSTVDPANLACTTRWAASGVVPEPATDDHPFPYVQGRSIPSFYVISLLAILVGSVLVVRFGAGAQLGPMRSYLDLFFMGVAFLLLETKNVVQFALLFGTTWFVNSLVFAGILLSVYLAIELARRSKLPPPGVLYAVLLVCLAVAWTVRPDALLELSGVPRFLAASALAFAPVFVANLIFSQRFRNVGASTVAFGANLLGAMAGGVLEYASIILGYRNLLFVVAALYGLAFVFGRRHLGERHLAPEPPGEHVHADATGRR